MGNIYSEEEIIVNMKDAGCDNKEIQDFINMMALGNKGKAFRILTKHRDELLDSLHRTQDCIGCLDYLVYRIEEQKEG